MFVKRFLDTDISSMPIDEAMERIKEAEAVREIEIGIISQAIVRAFEGN